MKLAPIVCLNCAVYFNDEGGVELCCPSCGHKTARAFYDRILKYSHEAVKFGHVYRRVYQASKDEGTLGTERACIRIDTSLDALALLAWSGLVGNLAWEVVKKMVVGLMKSWQEYEGGAQSKRHASLQDDQEIKEFLKNIEDFYSGTPISDLRVQFAVKEELVIDAAEEAVHGTNTLDDCYPVQNEPVKKDELKGFLMDVVERGSITKRPERSELGGLWADFIERTNVSEPGDDPATKKSKSKAKKKEKPKSEKTKKKKKT